MQKQLNSQKFIPKISRIFPLAKVSSAKVSSFKVVKVKNTFEELNGTKQPFFHTVPRIEPITVDYIFH